MKTGNFALRTASDNDPWLGRISRLITHFEQSQVNYQNMIFFFSFHELIPQPVGISHESWEVVKVTRLPYPRNHKSLKMT